MLVCFSLSSPLLCCFLRRGREREGPLLDSDLRSSFRPPRLCRPRPPSVRPVAPFQRDARRRRRQREGGPTRRSSALRRAEREEREREGEEGPLPSIPFHSIHFLFFSFLFLPSRPTVRPSVREGEERRGSEASKAPPPSPYHSLAQWPFMEATPLQGEKRTGRVYVFPPKLSSSSSSSIFSSILVFLPSSE